MFPLQFANIFLTYQTSVANLHLSRVENCVATCKKNCPVRQGLYYFNWKESATDQVSTIEENFLQNDNHFWGRGSILIACIIQSFQKILSHFVKFPPSIRTAICKYVVKTLQQTLHRLDPVYIHTSSSQPT